MPSAEAAPPAPAAGRRYDELHGWGPRGAWRPVLGIMLVALLFFAFQVLLTVVFAVYGLLTPTDYDTATALSGDPVTPSFLAFVNLGWAAAIPITWAVARVLHLMPPGFLASVAGRLRWRWFATCLGLALVALVLTLLVSSLLPDQGAGSVEMDASLNDWSAATRDFLLVVLLLTPLQAAGEEYVFRGYLAQSLGGLVSGWGSRASAVVAVALPAALFALAHGSQDLPIFFDRFAFGVMAGVLVLLTGGLEAGIAMHVLNNFLAFGLALAYGDMTEALQPTDGSWWAVPVTLTQSLSFLLLVLWAARRSGVATRTGRGVLESRRAPV